MKVLVTGAHGFLGKWLVNKLRETGLSPILLVRKEIPEQSGEVYTNLQSLLINHGHFDQIFHLAAHIPYGSMDASDPELIKVNVNLTAELLRQYPNSRFLLASSVSVFGTNPERPLKIGSDCLTPGAYGASKLQAEQLVEQHSSYAIIRFSSIIGPGMPAVSFIPRVIQKAKSEHVIPLLGDGARLQNYIDVRDAVTLLVRCASQLQNLKLLGIGLMSHSNLEIANWISRAVGAEIQHTGEDSSPHFTYDGQNMYDMLGFIPTFTLDQSIRDIVSV